MKPEDGAADGLDMHFVDAYPPGHFYSPLPSREELARVRGRVYGGPLPESLPGIDLRPDEQVALVAA